MDTIKASKPEDFLATIPHSLGFTPKDSFVVVALRDKVAGATIRIDSNLLEDPEAIGKLIVGYLSNDEDANAAMLVLYSNEHRGENLLELPLAAYVDAIDGALEEAGMPVMCVWQVTDDSWVPYWSDDEPQPLSMIEDSAVNAHLIFSGSKTNRSTAFDPDYSGDGEKFLEGLIYTTTQNALETPWDQEATARALWQDALNLDEVSEECAVRLVASLHSKRQRDRIVADIISTNEDMESYVATLVGEYPGKPDWDRVDSYQKLIVSVLGLTPHEVRAPLFTLLGWIAWHKGRGSTAGAYLEKALTVDPDYTLARLMIELISCGSVPICALNKTTAYCG